MNTSSVIRFSSFLDNEPRPTEQWDGVRSVWSVGDGVTHHGGPVGVLVNVHHIVGRAGGGEVLSNHVIGDLGDVVVVNIVQSGDDIEINDVVPSGTTSAHVHDSLSSLCTVTVPR